MNKLTRFIILMMVVMLATITNAQESETDHGVAKNELVNLSAYVPSDVDFFITIRTDQDYLAKLAQFLEVAGGHWDIPFNYSMVQTAIYSAISQPFYGSSVGVEQWLGDRVSIAIESLDVLFEGGDFTIPTIIFDITDQASADAYVNQSYSTTTSRSNVTIERNAREDGVIIYNVTDWDDIYYVQITEDHLIISPKLDYLGTLSDSHLQDLDSFNSLIDQLPADAYDVIGYVEPETLIEAYNNVVYGYASTYNEYRMDIDQLNLTPTLLGINIYDNRTLVIDIASQNEMGYTLEAIDSEMIRFVPSNALFFWNTTALGQSYAQFNANFAQVMAQIENMGMQQSEEIPFEIRHLLTFADLAFKGTTSVRAEDFVDGLNKDWLFYVSTVGNTFNFLNVIRSSDTDLTDPVVDYIEDALLDIFAGAREEDDLLKLSVPVNPVFGDQEIWFGTEDDLIVVGTEYDFKYEPRPDMVGMNSRRHYNYASSFFVDDPSQLFYVNMTQIRSFLDVLAQRANERDAREMRDVANFLSGLESIATSASNGDDYIIGRLTISLSEPIIR